MKDGEYTVKISTRELKESEMGYLDMLVVALARIGYAPYIDYDNSVCFDGENYKDDFIEEKTK